MAFLSSIAGNIFRQCLSDEARFARHRIPPARSRSLPGRGNEVCALLPCRKVHDFYGDHRSSCMFPVASGSW